MTQETRLAIMFADISGSTRLYDTLGDAQAHGIVARYVAMMTAAVQRHGGTLIKTIGDEVMAAFPSASAAADAACDMQEKTGIESENDGTTISLRIGFNFGQALLHEGDVYGDAVNLAARITGEAKAGQILTTGETAATLDGPRRDSCRQIDLTQVRGKNAEIAIFELLWQPRDATIMLPAASKRRVTSGQLVLIGAGMRLAVGEQQPVLTIGRGEQNDLVVRQPLVSRQHARIEFHHGRFILADVSANGTYVVMDGRPAVFTHRDSQELTGSGLLGLGEAVSPNNDTALRFEPG